MAESDLFIMPDCVHFVNISTLDAKSRLSASILVIESLPIYYRVDGVDDAEMSAAVAGLIGQPGSEIEQGFAAICGVEVTGIATFIKSELLPRARLIGAQALFRLLSEQSGKHFRTSLKNYNTGFGPIPDGSIYLSRFAVDQHYRGKGLAGQMMNRFLSSRHSDGDKRNKVFLHVDQSNHLGIAFYSKHGFAVHHTGTRYLTMVCSSAES